MFQLQPNRDPAEGPVLVANRLPFLPSALLTDGDTALLEALAKLTEARQAYARGGRSELAGLLGSAASLVKQVHHARAFEPAARAARDPADWFLD